MVIIQDPAVFMDNYRSFQDGDHNFDCVSVTPRPPKFCELVIDLTGCLVEGIGCDTLWLYGFMWNCTFWLGESSNMTTHSLAQLYHREPPPPISKQQSNSGDDAAVLNSYLTVAVSCHFFPGWFTMF